MAKKKQTLYGGVDVSAKTLHVAWRSLRGEVFEDVFSNDAEGIAKICRLFGAKKGNTRVVIEATGNYSLAVCVALHAAGVSVMVVNPLAAKHFMKAQMGRAKTDRIDAQGLLAYAERMAFEPWEPPTVAVLQLREIARRIQAVNVERTAEMNRLHAAKQNPSTPQIVIADLSESIERLSARAEALTNAAVEHANATPDLQKSLGLLMTVKGIAERSAVRILGELATLDRDMTPDQVVAYAGLDPRPFDSGTSVKGARRISKMGNAALRAALYMPVLVGVKHEPRIRAAYEAMLARNKPPKLAQIAIARRLLRVLWQMLRTASAFNADRFGATAEGPRTAS